MALSEEVLSKLISPNARKLSSPEGSANIGQIVDEGPIGNADDFDDSMFLGSTYDEPVNIESNGGYLSEAAAAKARAMTDYSSNNFNPARLKTTKMKNAILEDMVKHPIDTTALNTAKLESAGGGNAELNNSRLNQMLAGAKRIEESLGDTPGKKRTPIREQVQVGGGGNIDYALIKTIVNEAVETKLNDMGTLKAIGLSAGKIKLVDNKGNVFVAKLEYKGNVNDKNKGDD